MRCPNRSRKHSHGGWAWLWTLIFRAKLPPVLVPEPNEHREACDGAFVCATAVLEEAGELAVFVVSQFGRLLWSPLVFTEGFVAAAVDLVQSLREVETVALVACCGSRGTNVVPWGLLRLVTVQYMQ